MEYRRKGNATLELLTPSTVHWQGSSSRQDKALVKGIL